MVNWQALVNIYGHLCLCAKISSVTTPAKSMVLGLWQVPILPSLGLIFFISDEEWSDGLRLSQLVPATNNSGPQPVAKALGSVLGLPNYINPISWTLKGSAERGQYFFWPDAIQVSLTGAKGGHYDKQHSR